MVAYIAGHDHRGGYARDGPNGAHHVTMPSPLEAEPGTGSRYAVASLRADGSLLLRGEGSLCVEPMGGSPPRPLMHLNAGLLLAPPPSAGPLES